MNAEIKRLMKDDTAGDPISGIKWTRKTPGASHNAGLELYRRSRARNVDLFLRHP